MDDDGADDGTDGRTEDDDETDDGTGGRAEDGRRRRHRRRDGRRHGQTDRGG